MLLSKSFVLTVQIIVNCSPVSVLRKFKFDGQCVRNFTYFLSDSRCLALTFPMGTKARMIIIKKYAMSIEDRGAETTALDLYDLNIYAIIRNAI